MPLKEIGAYKVSYLQILNEEGEADPELEPALSAEELLSLYRSMVLGREADQRMLKLQRQGRLGTFPLATGQEASACGAAFALKKEDWFVGAYRELGARLMRGVPFLHELLYYNGYEEGNVLPEGVERTLPIAVIIASQLPHAVGIGYAMKLRQEKDRAVLTVMGDGATSQGDFHEALNFASVWEVPVVFLCQNNQWAISVPLEKQTRSKTIAQKAIAYEMPGIQVDGNDVLAVYKAVSEALDRARAGEGPSLVEAVTYRLMMHTTADDPTKYRSEEEEKEWWRRDPLVRFRRYLEKKKLWDEEKQEALEAEIRQEIDGAVKELESYTPSGNDTPFDHVFGTKHEIIEEQRAVFLAEEEREAHHG